MMEESERLRKEQEQILVKYFFLFLFNSLTHISVQSSSLADCLLLLSFSTHRQKEQRGRGLEGAVLLLLCRPTGEGAWQDDSTVHS